jgi:hypothetical protein
MGLGHSPSIIPDGLVFYFDPINTRSYAGTGLTGFNLINTAIVGTFTNGPVYDSANKGSINFDGVDDRISFSFNSTLDISQSITIEAYIKPKSYPVGGGGMILTKAASYYLELDSNGKIRVYFYGVSSPGYHESNGTISLNKWTHTVVTRDTSNNTINIYINGVLDKTVTGVTGNITVQQSFSLAMGGYNGSGYLFVGLITCGKIYNRALSSTEILQNYNVTKKRFSPEENIVKDGLVLNIDAGNNLSYPGTGITALNIAGVGATGILINGVGFGVSSGGSFIFDGTNDYIDCGTDSITNFATTTMTAEVMFQTTGATSRPHLIGRGTNGAVGQFVIVLENITPPKMRLWLDKGSGWAIAATGSSTILNNQWYHVVGVYDGTNAYVYLNGTLDVSAASTGPLRSIPSDSVTIGFYTGSSAHYLTGKIPFARLYNRALSSTEILQNYNALKGRYGLS